MDNIVQEVSWECPVCHVSVFAPQVVCPLPLDRQQPVARYCSRCLRLLPAPADEA